MNRVPVKPTLLRWARERCSLQVSDLARRFPPLEAWERGDSQPTLKQLERFARATHTPVGYLFLAQPPVEVVPIPDYRTLARRTVARPSPDLLDTVYLCQQRQAWYRDDLRASGAGPLPFVGSVAAGSPVEATAASLRAALGFDLDERRRRSTWTEALRRFVEQADSLGVLVTVSGVVGSNTHRRLDVDEFRGFALVDAHAPLVFVNGADSKSDQMFSLAHELAHVWAGQSAVPDSQARSVPEQELEGWCNRVAAELLVPLAALQQALAGRTEVVALEPELARRFKVSTLVILRRLHDARRLDREAFWSAYDAEVERRPGCPLGVAATST